MGAAPVMGSPPQALVGLPLARGRARERQGQVADLAGFTSALRGSLAALHAIDASDGPPAGAHNFFRGGPLATWDEQIRQLIRLTAGDIDAKAATSVWDTALASRWEQAPVWVHGDLTASNMLVADGALHAVIDFGAWPSVTRLTTWSWNAECFTGDSAAAFRRGLRLDEATWDRGRGWALCKALVNLGEEKGGGQRRRASRSSPVRMAVQPAPDNRPPHRRPRAIGRSLSHRRLGLHGACASRRRPRSLSRGPGFCRRMRAWPRIYAARAGALAGVPVADIKLVAERHGFRHLRATWPTREVCSSRQSGGGESGDAFAAEANGLRWLRRGRGRAGAGRARRRTRRAGHRAAAAPGGPTPGGARSSAAAVTMHARARRPSGRRGPGTSRRCRSTTRRGPDDWAASTPERRVLPYLRAAADDGAVDADAGPIEP